MVDFGFSQESANLIDSYFAVMIGIVAALALSSAARFFLVTTLGERIVADLREDVFGHLVSLSSAYFDAAKTGELISRLTADTTQIKAAVGASVSVALRNLVLFVGAAAMMVVTSPRLSAFVLAAIPVIEGVYGYRPRRWRRSRGPGHAIDAMAYASTDRRRAGTAGLHQRGARQEPFRRRRRARLPGRARVDQGARSPHRNRDLSRVRERGRGAVGGPGRAVGTHERRSAVAVRALRRVRRRRARPALRGRGVAGLRAERLFDPDNAGDVAPARPVALLQPSRGEIAFADVRFSYPTRPASPVLDGVSFAVRRGEKVAIVGPSGAGSTIFHLILRFYDPVSGALTFDGAPLVDVDPLALRRHIALVPQEAVIFAAPVRDNIRFGRRTRAMTRWSGRPSSRMRWSSSPGCRKDSKRRSASAG